MKATIKYIAPLLMAMVAGCGLSNSGGGDTDMCIVIDRTDKMAAYPTADEIVSPLGLRDDPYQRLSVRVTSISDKDVNGISVLTLEGESRWSSNINLRRAKVQQFTRQLEQCLAGAKFDGPRARSIVYRTVARQADWLATSTAARRYLLVYSDLYENDRYLNFYDPHTVARLKKDPQSVTRQLETTVPLPALNGVHVYLLYNPESFAQNNRYMTISGFYQHLLAAHGAAVYIQNKFIPL